MTVERKYETITVTAGQNIQAGDGMFRAVTLAGTIAGTTAAAVGIARSDAPSGKHLTVAYKGQMKAIAGAAVNSGAQLGVTTSGFLITVTTSAYCGVALASAASGEMIPFVGDFNFGRIA